MEYIMLKTKLAGVHKLVPIIFPDFMCHNDIDKAIKTLLIENHKLESETFSAGDLLLGHCVCSGRSSTLNISYNEIDSEVINCYDYFHGLIELEEDLL